MDISRGDKNRKVDELFSEWAKASSPGCAIGIMQNGEVSYQQGYGMANLEYDIPITPKTSFHVASVSKQFTAMAIALLASNHQLSLDDDVRQHLHYVPDFGETLTIRQMLHHTSGIRDQWDLLILAGWRMDDVITTDDVLELVKKQERLNFTPNSEYLYSNMGYTLLSCIVEEVSGKSLHEYCDEHIFKPLGMQDTHFHDDYLMLVPNRAYSYDATESGFQHEVLSYSTVGATSLHTTVGDLMRWANSFHSDPVWADDVMDMMHTKGVLNSGEEISYALGQTIQTYKGLKTVSHTGGDAGFRSYLVRFPDQNTSIVVLCNLGNMSPKKLAEQIADIYLADELTDFPEQEHTPIELTLEQLVDKVGIYYNAEVARTIRLELQNDQLMIMVGSGIPIVPLSETEFFTPPLPDTIFRFEQTGNSSRDVIEINPSSPPVRYKQMDKWSPSIDELQDYVGTYYSPELDFSFYILVQDDQLCVRRRKHGTTRLVPTFSDGFLGNVYPASQYGEGRLGLVFYRGDQNEILGFEASVWRVRHVQFVRQTGDK